MMLKELIWVYVIEDPALATQQLGQKHMIGDIYFTFTKMQLTPIGIGKSFQPIIRSVCKRPLLVMKDHELYNLIAGMTESQVYRIYNRLTGAPSESSLVDPLR